MQHPVAGPQKYVKQWPKATTNSQEGCYLKYFWGPGKGSGPPKAPGTSLSAAKAATGDGTVREQVAVALKGQDVVVEIS